MRLYAGASAVSGQPYAGVNVLSIGRGRGRRTRVVRARHIPAYQPTVDEYANGINKGVAILFWLHAGPFVLVYVLARKAITSRLANFLNRSA